MPHVALKANSVFIICYLLMPFAQTKISPKTVREQRRPGASRRIDLQLDLLRAAVFCTTKPTHACMGLHAWWVSEVQGAAQSFPRAVLAFHSDLATAQVCWFRVARHRFSQQLELYKRTVVVAGIVERFYTAEPRTISRGRCWECSDK